jgi:hypothetical protein
MVQVDSDTDSRKLVTIAWLEFVESVNANPLPRKDLGRKPAPRRDVSRWYQRTYVDSPLSKYRANKSTRKNPKRLKIQLDNADNYSIITL